MLVGLGEALVIVIDYRVEQISEDGVSLSIRSVNADTGVVILETRLNDVEEGRAERGLLGLQLIENFLGEVFLQERLAVGSGELGIASLQFVENCLVYHLVLAATIKKKRKKLI